LRKRGLVGGLERHVGIVLKAEYEGRRLRKGEGEERESLRWGIERENSDKRSRRVKGVSISLRVVCILLYCPIELRVEDVKRFIDEERES